MARPRSAPASSRMVSRERTVRVLICDDDPSLRTLLRIAFALEPDLEIVADASDGLEAIDLAGRHRPDVILLDLGMPRMDGLQALPKLRETVPDASIVVFSGYQESLLGKQALSLGAVAYVEKGASPSALADTIRDAAMA